MPEPRPSQSKRVIAWVRPTDMPGLVHVETSDGQRFDDITMGQLRYLAQQHDWDVRNDR